MSAPSPARCPAMHSALSCAPRSTNGARWGRPPAPRSIETLALSLKQGREAHDEEAGVTRRAEVPLRIHDRLHAAQDRKAARTWHARRSGSGDGAGGLANCGADAGRAGSEDRATDGVRDSAGT